MIPKMLERLRLKSTFVQDQSGIAITEFAICLPLLLLMISAGIELTNFVMVRQQVSQLALQVADNATRIGTQTSVQTQVNEKQVNDLFQGANLQATGMDFQRNGRIILSSLEVDEDPPKGQYIHWQRCYGSLAYPSSYGVEGDGKKTNKGSFTGMGPTGGKITALPGIPAIFVQIGYQYQPIITSRFVPTGPITETATMLVRDSRDTSGPGINPVAGVTPSTC